MSVSLSFLHSLYSQVRFPGSTPYKDTTHVCGLEGAAQCACHFSVILQDAKHLAFETCLSLTWNSANRLAPGQLASGICLSLPSQGWDYQRTQLCLESNSGPHACTTGTLPTEPSPQPHSYVFLHHFLRECIQGHAARLRSLRFHLCWPHPLGSFLYVMTYITPSNSRLSQREIHRVEGRQQKVPETRELS